MHFEDEQPLVLQIYRDAGLTGNYLAGYSQNLGEIMNMNLPSLLKFCKCLFVALQFLLDISQPFVIWSTYHALGDLHLFSLCTNLLQNIRSSVTIPNQLQ